MIFSDTLKYFNFFHFTISPLYFLICNLNIHFYPTLTISNIFLFTTACFTPLWYVSIRIWIGGVTCCSNCLGCFIHKKPFSWIRLRCTLLYLVSFFSVKFLNLRCNLLPWLIFFDCIYQKTFSCKYNPSRQLKICCTKSKNIWLRFIA